MSAGGRAHLEAQRPLVAVATRSRSEKVQLRDRKGRFGLHLTRFVILSIVSLLILWDYAEEWKLS